MTTFHLAEAFKLYAIGIDKLCEYLRLKLGKLYWAMTQCSILPTPHPSHVRVSGHFVSWTLCTFSKDTSYLGHFVPSQKTLCTLLLRTFSQDTSYLLTRHFVPSNLVRDFCIVSGFHASFLVGSFPRIDPLHSIRHTASLSTSTF